MDHSLALTKPLAQPSPSNVSRRSLGDSRLASSQSIPAPTSTDKKEFIENIPTLTTPPAFNGSDQFLKLKILQAEAKIAELEQYKERCACLEAEKADGIQGWAVTKSECDQLKKQNKHLIDALKRVQSELEEVTKLNKNE
ncbi:hypothetical protein SS50377_26314 [Spironucleus salmonicida]|uniref:Uncharacterized protein n=1 Tax=Spironucleus salmonicida TaxID=348837 RepID=V6M3F7_9EUKA|nr:hypothetical protein SS50377_26314 [Spironucleus salmonicida]|eukprot:EST47819.1 Hypothetical protein SS50377_12221 [Spironucleus salmonicida]